MSLFSGKNTGHTGDLSYGPRKSYYEGHLPSHPNRTTKMPELLLQHLGSEVPIISRGVRKVMQGRESLLFHEPDLPR